MDTRITEIADGTYQLTTYDPAIDFSLNQYVLTGDEPMLFHAGTRASFPTTSDAVGRLLPVESLRWIGFGHVEADECGALDRWLAAAPQATVVQGAIGCLVSITDLADRPPRPLGAGELLDTGGHVLEWVDTPHVPHGWDAGVLVDHSTRTLLCGDLFTRTGSYPATTTDDIVGPAVAAEDLFAAMSLHPTTAATIRSLAERDVATLAPMHAPAFTGDCPAALRALAADAERRINGLHPTG